MLRKGRRHQGIVYLLLVVRHWLPSRPNASHLDLCVDIKLDNADIKLAVTKLVPVRTKLQLEKAIAHHLRLVQRQSEQIEGVPNFV